MSLTNGPRFKNTLIALLFLSFALWLQGCYAKSLSTRVGSHQVKVEREGFVKRFGVTEREGLSLFQYEGYCKTGQFMQAQINNDEVLFNGKSLGRLRSGDSVMIDDDGLKVNALDYDATEKYLQANSRVASN